MKKNAKYLGLIMKQQSSVMEIQKQPIISEEPSISEKEDLPPCETLENVQIKSPEKEIPQKPEESGSIIKANLVLTIFHLGLNGCFLASFRWGVG